MTSAARILRCILSPRCGIALLVLSSCCSPLVNAAIFKKTKRLPESLELEELEPGASLCADLGDNANPEMMSGCYSSCGGTCPLSVLAPRFRADWQVHPGTKRALCKTARRTQGTRIFCEFVHAPGEGVEREVARYEKFVEAAMAVPPEEPAPETSPIAQAPGYPFPGPPPGYPGPPPGYPGSPPGYPGPPPGYPGAPPGYPGPPPGYPGAPPGYPGYPSAVQKNHALTTTPMTVLLLIGSICTPLMPLFFRI